MELLEPALATRTCYVPGFDEPRRWATRPEAACVIPKGRGNTAENRGTHRAVGVEAIVYPCDSFRRLPFGELPAVGSDASRLRLGKPAGQRAQLLGVVDCLIATRDGLLRVACSVRAKASPAKPVTPGS
jgi:hypothetical protein